MRWRKPSKQRRHSWRRSLLLPLRLRQGHLGGRGSPFFGASLLAGGNGPAVCCQLSGGCVARGGMWAGDVTQCAVLRPYKPAKTARRFWLLLLLPCRCWCCPLSIMSMMANGEGEGEAVRRGPRCPPRPRRRPPPAGRRPPVSSGWKHQHQLVRRAAPAASKYNHHRPLGAAEPGTTKAPPPTTTHARHASCVLLQLCPRTCALQTHQHTGARQAWHRVQIQHHAHP
jgi:hypothetical protein